jgi:hypothetical protein
VAQKIVAVVVGVVGLYLNIWHSNPLPFNHFQVFGGGQGGFGSQHYIHSIIGLALIAVAVWLWTRAARAGAPAA